MARVEALEERTLLAASLYDEPNDTISEACESGLTSATPGIFTDIAHIGDGEFSWKDVDILRVALNAGDQVVVDIDTEMFDPFGLDAALRVFRADGTEVAFSNDAPGPGEPSSTSDPYLKYTADLSGQYFIGVSTSANSYYNPNVAGSGSSSGGSGEYLIEVLVGGFTITPLASAHERSYQNPAVNRDGDVEFRGSTEPDINDQGVSSYSDHLIYGNSTVPLGDEKSDMSPQDSSLPANTVLARNYESTGSWTLLASPFSVTDKGTTFTTYGPTSINHSNQVVFTGGTNDGTEGIYAQDVYRDAHLYFPLDTVVDTGDGYSDFGPPSISGSTVVFGATKDGDEGVFRSTLDGDVTKIADTSDGFSAFGTPVISSDFFGEIAFPATRNSGVQGIFVAGSGGEFWSNVDTDLMPGIVDFEVAAINERNAIAFLAELDSGDKGIYIYHNVLVGEDPFWGPMYEWLVHEVVRTGDPLLDSTITELGFSRHGLSAAPWDPDVDAEPPIVAFRAELADGSEAIARADWAVASQSEPDAPDIVATSLDWNAAQAGVEFEYSVEDADLSQPTTAALYWASGTGFADVIGNPVYDTQIDVSKDDYGPYYVPNSVLGTPPAGATHLLLVVDPDNLIEESDEPNAGDFGQNNVRAIEIQTDIVATSLTWNTSTSTIDYTYEVKDAHLPTAATGGLYWSKDDTFDASDTLAIAQSFDLGTQQNPAGSPYSDSVSVADLEDAPQDAQHLLLVVDVTNAIWESDELTSSDFGQNNVKPVRVGALVFREKAGDDKDGTWGKLGLDEIPGFDHVGLAFLDSVYESHPGYHEANYWDTARGQFVSVPNEDGVQAVHTYGSFMHDSTSQVSSPVTRFYNTTIPAELALEMAGLIDSQDSAGFQTIDYFSLDGIQQTLSPEAQKGGGGTFTCVGVVEWAAEQAGHNSGEGFVPNDMESITVPSPGGDILIPVLSPELLYYCVIAANLIDATTDWLVGLFDPVDFMLTDPQGRRLGFTEEDGFINEIPTAFYTGDGDLEQFLILDPVPGDYTLDLAGVGNDALAALGTRTTSDFFSGFLADSEFQTLDINVGRVDVEATLNADTIVVIPGTVGGDWHQVVINDVSTTYDPAIVNQIHIDGLGGDDRVDIFGLDDADDTFFGMAGASRMEVDDGSLVVWANNFETVYGYAGTSKTPGGDQAYLSGTVSDDTFVASDGSSYVTGGGYLHATRQFDMVEVDATDSGGTDKAYFNDTTGDDDYYGQSTQAWIELSSGVTNKAIGFPYSRATSSGSGTAGDRAFLTGADGQDKFIARFDIGYMFGTDYLNSSAGFDYVQADVSGTTGADWAYFFGTGGDDTYYGAVDESRIELSNGVVNKAIGFPYSRATSSGSGTAGDRAFLTGADGQDKFIARFDIGYMFGTDYLNSSAGFDYVQADVSGTTGADWAYFFGTGGDDTYYGAVDESRIELSNGVVNKAIGFPNYYALAAGESTGDDTAYLSGSIGDDTFVGGDGYAYIYADGILNSTRQFGYVEADVTGSGGSDTATLYDSSLVDLFIADGDEASVDHGDDGDFELMARSFSRVNAYSIEGGPDEKDGDQNHNFLLMYYGTEWE